MDRRSFLCETTSGIVAALWLPWLSERRRTYVGSACYESGAPLTGCATVDESAPDVALECVRGGIPAASTCGSTAEAVTRISTCLGARKLMVHFVGHGDTGLITTGEGAAGNDPDKHIGIDNEDLWRPYLSQLRDKVASLTLWGCHTGLGNAGADLLFAVAQVVNAPVAAPTGLITCDNGDLILEPGTKMQVATPIRRPAPLTIADPMLVSLDGVRTAGRGDSSIARPAGSDACITFALPGTDPSSQAGHVTLPAEVTADLLRLVRFDHPVELRMMPLAKVTGRLSIQAGAQGQGARNFTLLNDRLLSDDQNPRRFYPVSSSFGLALRRRLDACSHSAKGCTR